MWLAETGNEYFRVVLRSINRFVDILGRQENSTSLEPGTMAAGLVNDDDVCSRLHRSSSSCLFLVNASAQLRSVERPLCDTLSTVSSLRRLLLRLTLCCWN